MNDDLLKAAARALRRETESDEDSGKFTRARVMATLHQSTVRRRTRLAFVLPIAASFAAATAWGTVSGRAPEIARNVVQALGLSLDTPPPPPPPQRPRRGNKAAPAPSSRAEEPPKPIEPLPEPAPAPTTAEAPAPASPRPANSGQGGARELDLAHELYRSAHRAHFGEQNCGRAVQAWSAYLRAAPRGRFAPEARYNRALCWVRLGERDLARSALGPFARGQYGTYRQRDAQALIDALGR
jgi:hypothetical protein